MRDISKPCQVTRGYDLKKKKNYASIYNVIGGVYTVSQKMYSRPRTHHRDVKQFPLCFLARSLLSHLVFIVICTKVIPLFALFLKYKYISTLQITFHFNPPGFAPHNNLCWTIFFFFSHVNNVDSTNHNSTLPYALQWAVPFSGRRSYPTAIVCSIDTF